MFEVVPPTMSIVTRAASKSSSAWEVLKGCRFPVNRIYCVGRNYREHALEMGGNPDREPPFYFQKPANAMVDTIETCSVHYPPMTSNLHYEGELVVALGKSGQNVSERDASDYIYGYAVGCDLTRRDLQAQAKQESRPWDTAKGFDSSAPCGPIVQKGEMELTDSTVIALHVNNKLCQESTLGHMIWSIPEMISHLSKYFRIQPGDLIFTGTPAGVGPLKVNDSVDITCGDLPPCAFSIVDPLKP
jgi:fumarylpyruvate hydrolase